MNLAFTIHDPKSFIMKKIIISFSILILFAQKSISQDVTYPRQLTNQGSVITFYQPQVDSWEKYKKLEFRSAFSLKPAHGKEVLGVLYASANTEANMETHRVLINGYSISKVHFPTLDTGEKKLEELVRSFLTPDRSLVMSVEQVVASIPKVDSTKTVKVINNPPVIFMSKVPTVLLAVEGTPVKAAANKENLEFVVNANLPLFFSKPDSTWYLYDGLGWQKAKESEGPWSFTNKLPASIINLSKDSNWIALKGTVPAPPKDKKMPMIFYSEKIAELILFDGEPEYKSISGTGLKYATNTYSDIFFSSSDKQYYYVTSGRWFRSGNLNGPWTFASADLPADFSKIPDNSPASAILVFVPGTEAAKDAVMIAQIPNTVQVNAKEAAKQVQINYSGEPVFKPIDSTSMSYAVNTTEKVIKISNNEFYACVKGIWFTSSTATGPWATATSVPPVIYSMPVSSPVYNVTYVTQNVSYENPEVVESSYTSGYLGVFAVAVGAGIIIASGTGYYYPPYYYYGYGYPMYYPYAVTYGMYAYHPYHYGHVAYRASYNPNTGMYGRSATAYGPYGKATVAQGYNPTTGTYARGASVSTPYGSRSVAQAYNPYTGASASTRQNSSPHAQWGSTTVRNGSGQSFTTGHITTAGGTVKGIKTGSGDVYAGRNGEVYKRTDGGWESVNRPEPKGGNSASTRPVTGNNASTRPATGNSSSSQPSFNSNDFNREMNKEASNRSRGNYQTQNYNRSSSARTYGGGGGMRGGGGGGRRR